MYNKYKVSFFLKKATFGKVKKENIVMFLQSIYDTVLQFFKLLLLITTY